MAHPGQYKDDFNLAELLAEKLTDPALPGDYCIDDFFDDAGVDQILRSDFAFTAILNQAYAILKWE